MWVTYCETILNIIRNFIPHEIVTCEDRDPPWMTSLIEKAIKDKNLSAFCKKIQISKIATVIIKVLFTFKNLTNTNETTKHQYFTNIAEKLSDSNISYWFILKCFLTGKKVPSIPPIFHEQRFIDYSEKAELFNSSFANQCSLVRKRSVLISNFLQINSYQTSHLQTMILEGY